MSAPIAYPRADIITFLGTERCRANTKRSNGSLLRCGNRARTEDGGLCWRHR